MIQNFRYDLINLLLQKNISTLFFTKLKHKFNVFATFQHYVPTFKGIKIYLPHFFSAQSSPFFFFDVQYCLSKKMEMSEKKMLQVDFNPFNH